MKLNELDDDSNIIENKIAPTYQPGWRAKKELRLSNKAESDKSQARIIAKYCKQPPRQSVKVVGHGLMLKDF